jgi:hypothetical protein
VRPVARGQQGWRRFSPRQVSYNTRLLLATLRNMRAGLRFADGLPAETGAPAVVQGDGNNPFEAYFDSVTEGPGVWKWRHYFPIYARHLSKFIDQEVHLVEIGIYSGGSLPMWRSAFGPGCRVYGVDIDPACLAHEQEGVCVFIGDQADPIFWEDFVAKVPRIDVVIDDGGHQAHQQITSLSCLLPQMAMGGVYIVEDTLSSHHGFHSFVDGATRRLSDVYEHAPVAPVHRHIASVHRYPQLTVLEKPEQPVEPFDSPKHGTVWRPETYI